MTETEMSLDSLDTSLVDLKIGETTIERLACSIIKGSDNDGRKSPMKPDTSGLLDEDLSEGGGGGGLEIEGGIPLDLSMKVSTSAGSGSLYSTKNLTDTNNNDRDKMWSGSMRDLSHTIDKILASGGGFPEDRRPSELSYLGVSPSLGEMLLQHGEFPATPLFTPTPRYRSTPLDANFRKYSDSRNHNVAFASISSSLGQNKYNIADLTYGLKNPVEQRSGQFLRSFMMATPENLVTNATPRFSLTGLQQSTINSLPSVVSWRAGEGEERWCSFTSGASLSRGSKSINFYSPLTDESYPKASQTDEPPLKTRRSEPRPHREWMERKPPIPTAHLNHLNAPPAHSNQQNAHVTPVMHPPAHVPHHTPYGSKEGISPRKALIQDVVLKESTRAFRSHPLFPLLKDLSVADYYFEKAPFNVAPLLSYLPNSTEDLVALFLRRNPEVAISYRCHQSAGHTPAVDTVLLDAIAYAHSCLLEKISTQTAKVAAAVEAEATDTEAAVEEMCQRYMEVIRSSTPLHILKPLASDHPAANPPDPSLENDPLLDPIHQLEQLLAPFSPIPPSFFGHDSSTTSLNISLNTSDSRRKTHQHPREAVEVLTSWLSEHRDHPYPDDDQKASLVRKTGLSAQQIAHWFTNARRRLLPKLRADLTKDWKSERE